MIKVLQIGTAQDALALNSPVELQVILFSYGAQPKLFLVPVASHLGVFGPPSMLRCLT